MLKVICVTTVLTLVATADAVEIYAVDMADGVPSSLVKFDSNNVGGMRWVGPMRIYGVTSLEWVGSSLYAYGAGLPGLGLYRINPTNGASTFIGTGGVEPGIDIEDFSFNPRDGQLYALGDVPFPYTGPPRLYTINTATGYATKLGNVTGMPNWEIPVGLAADLDGTMYIADLESDRMYKLPFGSLNATPLPEKMGFESWYDGGMTIDWAGDGRWHFAAYSANPYRSEYRLVDKSTGWTTLVGPFPGSPVITDLAIVPEPAALALLGVAALALRRR